MYSWYNLCSGITLSNKHSVLRRRGQLFLIFEIENDDVPYISNTLFGLAYSDETKSTCWTHPGSGFSIQSGHFSWPGKKKLAFYYHALYHSL